MNCRYPGCSNKPTKWSRHSFCGEHRGAARALAARAPQAQDKKASLFDQLQKEIQQRFNSTKNTPVNAYGYQVFVRAPNGLHT